MSGVSVHRGLIRPCGEKLPQDKMNEYEIEPDRKLESLKFANQKREKTFAKSTRTTLTNSVPTKTVKTNSVKIKICVAGPARK